MYFHITTSNRLIVLICNMRIISFPWMIVYFAHASRHIHPHMVARLGSQLGYIQVFTH